MENEKLYVLVAERDHYKPDDRCRPIVFEQYTDQGAASLENVKVFQEKLGDKYGKTRIAQLQFIEE